MRFDRSIVDIRPRTTLEVLDLALQFYRDHLVVHLMLALILGAPALALGFLLTVYTGEIWLTALGFWLLLPLSSGAVILTASRSVFGVHVDVRSALSLYRPLFLRHLVLRLAHRALWLPLIPLGVVFGELLRLKWAFAPMIQLLERLEGQLATRRRQSLNRRGGANAFGFDMAALTLAASLTVAMAFVLDFVFSDILSVWEFGGLFSEPDSNPIKVAIWMACILVITPVVDLAWFFFYLDARIRKEGWDLELGFRSITARWTEQDRRAA